MHSRAERCSLFAGCLTCGENNVLYRGSSSDSTPLAAADIQRLLLGALAHEMSNPLSCVISNIEYLQDVIPQRADLTEADDASDARTVLEDLQAGADQLRERLRDIREYLQPVGETTILLSSFIGLCVVAARSHGTYPAMVRVDIPESLEVHACRIALARAVLEPLLHALEPGAVSQSDRVVHLTVNSSSSSDSVVLLLEHNGPSGPLPNDAGQGEAAASFAPAASRKTMRPTSTPPRRDNRARLHRVSINLPVRLP
ncbi:MAG: hypothetical protein EA398_07585 [Deltaproteobacteria bacterium]|nr:MAG: hypothetical protein EA398_07585 [Deltaproteobacteria bacterium]